jgi:hypothetical protein
MSQANFTFAQTTMTILQYTIQDSPDNWVNHSETP